MPYFNPNKVDFNYNTNTIDAVGATGRALWDIYQDSVRNNFTKQRLAEENRSNLATECCDGECSDRKFKHKC